MNHKTDLINEQYKGKKTAKCTIMEDCFCKLCIAVFVLLAVVALIY